MPCKRLSQVRCMFYYTHSQQLCCLQQCNVNRNLAENFGRSHSIHRSYKVEEWLTADITNTPDKNWFPPAARLCPACGKNQLSARNLRVFSVKWENQYCVKVAINGNEVV